LKDDKYRRQFEDGMKHTKKVRAITEEWHKKKIAKAVSREGSLEEDWKRNTDLITEVHIYSDRTKLSWAMRFRRFENWRNWMDNFTVRSKLDSGRSTELDKTLAGFGDYMFYGWHMPDKSDIFDWMIIDLREFSKQISAGHNKDMIHNFPNGDGTYFNFYNLNAFDPGIVVAQRAGKEISQLIENGTVPINKIAFRTKPFQ